MGKHLTLPTLRGNNSYSHALKSIILESRWIGYVQMEREITLIKNLLF
jgi:hypothetical protein